MTSKIEFTIERCKTKAAYSAKLKKQRLLDLKRIAKKDNENHDVHLIIETPVLLVVKDSGVEAVVYKYGEILFKECSDVPLMEKIAEKIFMKGLKK